MFSYIYDFKYTSTYSPRNEAMGSGGQVIVGSLTNPAGQIQNNMQSTCGSTNRIIFAPFSRKVAPYDTFAFLLKGIDDI